MISHVFFFPATNKNEYAFFTGQAGLSASMRYHVGSSDVSFASGRVVDAARTVSIDLHDGWTVQVHEMPPSRQSARS